MSNHEVSSRVWCMYPLQMVVILSIVQNRTEYSSTLPLFQAQDVQKQV